MLSSLEIIGIAIVVGFLASKILLKIKLPAVAAYVFIGVIIGPSLLDIFHEDMLQGISVVNDLALGIVAFMIGGELRWLQIKRLGFSIMCIVVMEALAAFILVSLALNALTGNLSLSLILGSIAAATAPAATVMVIQEMKAKGSFTQTLLAVVAIDDAIALMIFSFSSALAKALITKASRFDIGVVFNHALQEILISVLIGALFGILTAFLVRKLQSKEDLFIFWLGVFLVLAGFSKQLEISLLLACMTFGVVMINILPPTTLKILNMLNSRTPPLFIAFFVTAGAHLNFKLIFKIWKMAIVYTIARIVGKIIGASLGATISGADPDVKKYLGFGLISQVGVAVGLSLIVSSQFSQYGWEGQYIANVVINLLLSTTIITELIGPVMTKKALIKTGNATTGVKK